MALPDRASLMAPGFLQILFFGKMEIVALCRVIHIDIMSFHDRSHKMTDGGRNMATRLMDKQEYKIALVINEYSRGGNFRDAINEVLFREINKFQTETGHNVAISFTRTRDHIRKAINSLKKEGYNMFVVCGGDGTMNDTIQFLDEGHVFIPIPMGNANDFAKRLNIGHWRDSVEIVRGIIKGKVNLIGIDVGEISFFDGEGRRTSRRFVNNLGIGVTAETVRRLEGKINKTYLQTGFTTLMGARPFKITYYSTQFTAGMPTSLRTSMRTTERCTS